MSLGKYIHFENQSVLFSLYLGNSVMETNSFGREEKQYSNGTDLKLGQYPQRVDSESIMMTKYLGVRNVFPNNPKCSIYNLFACCCGSQFSLKKGSGYIGGARSSIASMETYHIYQKFKDILKFLSSENRSPISRNFAR